MNTIVETIGWAGVVLIIGAYALSSFGILEVHSTVYALMNIVGSLGIIIDAIKDKNYQPVVLNIIWMIIAAINMARIFI